MEPRLTIGGGIDLAMLDTYDETFRSQKNNNRGHRITQLSGSVTSLQRITRQLTIADFAPGCAIYRRNMGVTMNNSLRCRLHASVYIWVISLCENTTSSINPEVHNVLHCRWRGIEPLPQVTCTENFVKFGHVFLDIGTDRQTRRRTDRRTDHSILGTLCCQTRMFVCSVTSVGGL